MTTPKRRASASEPAGAAAEDSAGMAAATMTSSSTTTTATRLDKDDAGVEDLVKHELGVLLEMAKPYFEHVETKVVLRRLVHSMVPMHQPTVALIAEPDLYGPVVLAATEALLLQTAGFSLIGGIVMAFSYWMGLSSGLYLASRRILHEFRPASGAVDAETSPLRELDEEEGGAGEASAVAASSHGKGRHIYLVPLRLDQLLCVCGYGLFSHCLLLGLSPASGVGLFLILCKLCVLLSSSASIGLVVFRSMSVLANHQVASLMGAGTIAIHALLWPALLGRFP